MTGVRRSVIIKAILEKYTWPDLAAIYNDGMECQVNVAQDGGERIDKEYKGHSYHEFSDGVQAWKSFRIPLNAMSEPEDNDTELFFDLETHFEGIGGTGWNWKQKKSCYVAYDFDAVIGHSESHTKKLEPAELAEIKKKLANIEWVTLRNSTGGSGLHLYVFLDCKEVIANHNEHQALGRAVLSQLSALAGFDLDAKVDVNAGNMWLCHRKMTRADGTRNPSGLALIKPGTALTSIPTNWRDNLDVVTGKRARSIPFFIQGEEERDLFEEMTSQRPKIALDKEHQRLIDWISSSTPGGSWWRNDHWMLVTHTAILKEAHKALGLKGQFETIATGENYGADHNAYAYPLANGAWTVRRYTRGTQEANTWTHEPNGYTKCEFNKLPDFKLACRLSGGVEKPNGSWVFTEAQKAINAAKMMGSVLTLPEKMLSRTAFLSQHKDRRLIIKIEKDATKDTADGMLEYDGSGKHWEKIFDSKVEHVHTPIDNTNLDKIVRHIVNEGGRDNGWVIKSENQWNGETLEHVKLMLKGFLGFKPQEAEQILGSNVIQPYKLVNRPFDVEFPPGRLWNRKGAKLRFAPSQNIDSLKFPTWSKIFNHLGSGLTPYLINNPWAKNSNIINGAEYLTLWVACMFQKPSARLPYLFLYSEAQNTGKSALHEAIVLLMGGDPPNGYFKVNDALRAAEKFNAELQFALLCVVEELDLNPRRSDAKISYNRIKELVTANSISIHEKRETPVMVKNYTHWIHCSNDKTACPIFKNDSRITMIRAQPIDEIDLIPKDRLLELLLKEGPDFLAHILRLEIPPSNDRLLVPVIETEDKATVQMANMSVIEQFISEKCHIIDGNMILWNEFYQQFQEWMEPTDVERWTKRFTGLHLPEYHPRGRRPVDNQFCIANISWTARDPDAPVSERLVLKNEKLIAVQK